MFERTAILVAVLALGGCPRRSEAPAAQQVGPVHPGQVVLNEQDQANVSPNRDEMDGTGEDSKPQGGPRPSPPPPGAVTTLRAGARRLEAFRRGSYQVAHVADPSVRLDRVRKACRGRTPTAELGPFVPGAVPGGAYQVSDGPKIVADALGAQLGSLGWRVELVVEEVPGKGTRSAAPKTRGRDDPPEESRTGSRPPAPPAPRFGFAGKVTFYVEDGADGADRAVLQGEIGVSDAATGKVLHHARPSAAELVTVRQEPERTRRQRRAESAALAAFVRALLGDPALEQAIVSAIR